MDASGVEEVDIASLVKSDTIENKKYMYRFFKRTFDIIGGILGIILLFFITIVLFFVRIFMKEDRGPLFYDQLRVGKNGKEFKLYKYRTMILNADEVLYKYLEENPDAKKEYKKYKKLKDDPRITKFGKFLRKTSVDEFPQFINLIKGEMSLVGPRPYLHREIEDMGSSYKKIITCKPGITGYWQVNGRSGVDFEERLEMDCYYIDNKNLIMDIKIIFKTIAKVFRKDGAV